MAVRPYEDRGPGASDPGRASGRPQVPAAGRSSATPLRCSDELEAGHGRRGVRRWGRLGRATSRPSDLRGGGVGGRDRPGRPRRRL